jgi:hypothetical protein
MDAVENVDQMRRVGRSYAENFVTMGPSSLLRHLDISLADANS